MELNYVEQNNAHPSMPRFFANSLVSKERTFAYEEGLQELVLNAEYVILYLYLECKKLLEF